MIETFNALLCGGACLRLLLFVRAGAAYRPWASVLAYLLVVAFGCIALLTLLGLHAALGWAQLLLNGVLIAALFAVDGNVVELFRPVSSGRQSFLLRWLRRETWI